MVLEGPGCRTDAMLSLDSPDESLPDMVLKKNRESGALTAEKDLRVYLVKQAIFRVMSHTWGQGDVVPS